MDLTAFYIQIMKIDGSSECDCDGLNVAKLFSERGKVEQPIVTKSDILPAPNPIFCLASASEMHTDRTIL
jgi:hypothetical protein